MRIIVMFAVVFGLSTLSENSFAKKGPFVLGMEWAKKVYERPDGESSIFKSQMILQEKGSSPRIRDFYVYREDGKSGEISTLVRFTNPADIKNTGLLTLDFADGESDQWVYLSALKRSRRISSSRKGGRFVGSDIYFEDIQDRIITKDKHRYVGKFKLAGVKVVKIESIPVKKDNSVYIKRISWVDPKTYIPLRIDFFEKSMNTPSKRMRVNKVSKVQGIWSVMDSTVMDLSSGHTTKQIVKKIKYNKSFPKGFFGKKGLEDPKRESKLRKF